MPKVTDLFLRVPRGGFFIYLVGYLQFFFKKKNHFFA